LTQIFGNSQAQEKLKAALEHQVRSLCLTGPAHVGKSTCLRGILSDLVPETDLFLADTKIDSAREAVEFCKTQPLAGQNRHVVVDDAHLMGEPAQDAYLKLLEDPGNHACIAFVTPDEGLLQPAIASRFRSIIRWKNLSLGEMRNCAQALGAGDDSRALMLCDGRPGLFRAMYEEDQGNKHAELHQLVLRALEGQSNILLEPTPELVKDAKEPLQRECVAHVCRAAAITVLKFKKIPVDRVAAVLRYAATLLSVPPATSEVHWLRMASHLM
jgi:replication-associated recombination protein RarA